MPDQHSVQSIACYIIHLELLVDLLFLYQTYPPKFFLLQQTLLRALLLLGECRALWGKRERVHVYAIN